MSNETFRLSSLFIHPIKSCAGLALDEIELTPRGPRGDRCWMIVDEHGRFLTGRQHPKLTRVQAQFVPGSEFFAWQLRAPGQEPIVLAAPDAAASREHVTVWRSTVNALMGDAASAEWISAYLGISARFVYMDTAAVRPVDPTYAQPGDEVSFADGFPLLLISEGSLNGLNERLRQPLPMRRFRPNLVVSANTPHAEDRWRRLRIGGVILEVVKPCARCVFTTVDPETGTFDPDFEPMRTLSNYRRTEAGVMFGQNLIARSAGRLRVGDVVEILE